MLFNISPKILNYGYFSISFQHFRILLKKKSIFCNSLHEVNYVISFKLRLKMSIFYGLLFSTDLSCIAKMSMNQILHSIKKIKAIVN